MKIAYRQCVVAAVLSVLAAVNVFAQADPLPSWNEGRSKKSIMDFVTKVTKPGSPDFVPPAERIATFDNDGTLWGDRSPRSATLTAICQMLQWTCAGAGARFCLYVRHTDGDREWNYDITSLGLEKGLEEARAKAWTAVDMKTEGR